MIEMPVSLFYLLLALAAYGILVSAIMFSVAVANLIQRTTMQKEVSSLEREIVSFRKQMTLSNPDSSHITWTGMLLKHGEVDANGDIYATGSVGQADSF